MKHALKKRFSVYRKIARRCGSWLCAEWYSANNYRFFKKRKGIHLQKK